MVTGTAGEIKHKQGHAMFFETYHILWRSTINIWKVSLRIEYVSIFDGIVRHGAAKYFIFGCRARGGGVKTTETPLQRNRWRRRCRVAYADTTGPV